MSVATQPEPDLDEAPELDFSRLKPLGRGIHYRRTARGRRTIKLPPDLAVRFRTDAELDAALRPHLPEDTPLPVGFTGGPDAAPPPSHDPPTDGRQRVRFWLAPDVNAAFPDDATVFELLRRNGDEESAHPPVGRLTVTLAPDVAEAFPTSDRVNAALRAVLRDRSDAAGDGGR